jgi:hypothetical protein
VMCIAVSHHLTGQLLEQLIDESERVSSDEAASLVRQSAFAPLSQATEGSFTVRKSLSIPSILFA